MVTMAPSHISNTHTHTHRAIHQVPLLLSLASVNPQGIHPLELATLLLLVASLQVDRLLTSHLLVGLSGRAIQNVFLMLIRYFRRAKCNEEAAVQQTFHLERSSFFYLLAVDTQCSTFVLYFALSYTEHRPDSCPFCEASHHDTCTSLGSGKKFHTV